MPRTAGPWLALAALAAMLGGCAQAMPGYVPMTPKPERILAAAPKGGGFDSDGGYHLTEQEQKLDCRQLTGSVTLKILQMRAAGDRVQASTAATATQAALRPFRGGTTLAMDNAVDYKQDRARLETLNRRLAEKNCRTFDIGAELKPGNTAQPAPIGDAPKSSKKK